MNTEGSININGADLIGIPDDGLTVARAFSGGDLIADDQVVEVGPGMVNVVYGAHDINMPLGGLTVEEIQYSLLDVLNVRMDAEAYLDGNLIEDKTITVGGGLRLEFMKGWGTKAAINLLNLQQAARDLGLTPSGLRKLVAKKEIRYFQRKAHSPIMFRPEWLEEYVEKHTVASKDDLTDVMPPTRRRRQAKSESPGSDVCGFSWELLDL
jgi:hypothetical protein